jgi:hypothetical protein
MQRQLLAVLSSKVQLEPPAARTGHLSARQRNRLRDARSARWSKRLKSVDGSVGLGRWSEPEAVESSSEHAAYAVSSLVRGLCVPATTRGDCRAAAAAVR